MWQSPVLMGWLANEEVRNYVPLKEIIPNCGPSAIGNALQRYCPSKF